VVKSSLHGRKFQRGGQVQAEPLEEDRLVFGRTADAAFADGHAAAGRQRDLYQRHTGEFLENLSRFIPEARHAAGLGQCLPQHVCQKANQDVRPRSVDK